MVAEFSTQFRVILRSSPRANRTSSIPFLEINAEFAETQRSRSNSYVLFQGNPGEDLGKEC